SVTYVPVDFERERLDEALRRAGLPDDAPALFSWLGVVPYLEREAIRATLCSVAGRKNATLVFDWGEPRASLGLLQRMAFDAMASRVAAVNEPWITFFTPGEIAAELRAAGFSCVRDMDGPAVNAMYFAGRADGLRVGSIAHLMRASSDD